MGDDIVYWNISAYNRGMMGYRTPNIDRIAERRRDLHRLLWPAIRQCSSLFGDLIGARSVVSADVARSL